MIEHIELRIYSESKYSNIVNDGYDVNTVIKNISFANPSFNFVDNKTIITFDEIQEYPDVATTLKSFNNAYE